MFLFIGGRQPALSWHRDFGSAEDVIEGGRLDYSVGGLYVEKLTQHIDWNEANDRYRSVAG